MVAQVRLHEVAFCADVKSWMEALFAQHPDWPFSRVAIEEYGVGSQKRQDIRVYGSRGQTPILCGEVKMPGTPEGRSPYDPALMQDAFQKADNIQSKYFFTWNVNHFVLFDRSQWQVALVERRIKDWDLGLSLRDAASCRSPDVQTYIREKFLPAFLAEFADIVTGRLRDWAKPPDDIFISSLNTNLDWPVLGTFDYLAERSATDKVFASKLQSWMSGEMGWTFVADGGEEWRKALDRVAHTLCYVFSNRAIFYNALRTRFSERLEPLRMPARAGDPDRVYRFFRERFEAAVRESGDYEPIFYPQVADWAGAMAFASPQARQGWQGFFVGLDHYNFRQVPSDILGRIFKKLISPEERRRFGQFFTQDDIVDVINAFCIRRAGDVVLDPASGSGSFLVRAYHRKAWLAQQSSGGRRHVDHEKTHQQLLGEIFGCDIAVFPAHLATLNLAARQITDEENYPCIARRNFFDAAADRDAFCFIPTAHGEVGGQRVREARAVPLPDLDAVVGNPPYVRQELIPRLGRPHKGETQEAYQARVRQTKEYLAELIQQFWPGLKLSGRSDLHCYFWPVATGLLKEGGHFGFLTSSSWLDVEYGFALQAWILRNFKLIAVIESVDEPWFEDARIKTAVTILQRCADPKARDENLVKFVRLARPLAEILGLREPGDEAARQKAAERLRSLIEKTKIVYRGDRLRIIPIRQRDLWEEGVRAGAIIGQSPPPVPDEAEDEEVDAAEAMNGVAVSAGAYAAGKWGRFLRAPDLYFRLMRRFGHRFVKLGEIAEIRFGVKSGCDAFFMPRDVTDEILAQTATERLWLNAGLMTHCPRQEVESGKVRIVRAGDNTLHPIEAEYLRPEVHSLMQVDRPVIREKDLDRVVLWVKKPLDELAGTYVAKYIRWGAKQTFASEKSKPVRVPQRSTCASRPIWYDLTSKNFGIAFWPMAQQYRHLIAANPEQLACNHNLFYISIKSITSAEAQAMIAVLNSTLMALVKTYYGRYAGTEGNLKTEVVDVNLMDVPDPRNVSHGVLRRLRDALASMQRREVGRLVEEEFMDCHTAERVKELAKKPIALSSELQQPDRRELDDAVLEMLGVADASERRGLLEELYFVTARHYRQIRIVEVQKMEQRARGSSEKFTANDLAESVWDCLTAEERGEPVVEWLASRAGGKNRAEIPEGKAKANGTGHLFEPRAVVFTSGGQAREVVYASVEQAALVAMLADLGIRGEVELPAEPAACKEALKSIGKAISKAKDRFGELARSRTGTPSLQDRTAQLLLEWFIHGRSR